MLSRQIAVLDRELGVALFERSKQGTQLTEAGELLREDARALLRTAAALQRRARSAGRAGKEFTVGFMPGIIVTPAVRRLEEEFPGLRVGVVRTSLSPRRILPRQADDKSGDARDLEQHPAS